MMNATQKAYSYIRMSTDAQLKGDSLRRQLRLSEAYAAEHCLDLQRQVTFADIGVSAFHGANLEGRLGAFLSAVQDGTVERGSYLLVESFDRLSRDRIEEALALFLQITRSGINLVTLADRQIYKAGETNLQQLIVSLVSMSRANEESEIKSQRVRAAWDNKRARIAAEPLTSKCPAWLKRQGQGFVEIPERGQLVRRVFGMAVSGMGADSIARGLNREAVAPFGRSNGWGQSYVKKILQNRAVLGEFQPHRKVDGKRVPAGEPVADYFPRLIDDNTFWQVQAARRSRGRSAGGRRGNRAANLFTHLARCAYCGAPMHFVNKGTGPRGGCFLRCRTSIRGMGCVSRGWPYPRFETAFLFFARELDLGGIMRSASVASQRGSIAAQLAANTEKMHQLEIRRERVFAMIDDPSTGIEFLRGKLAEVEQAMQDARDFHLSLELALEKASAPETSADDLRALIDELQSEGPATVRKRVEVAARLREIVTSLSLAAAGDLPATALAQRYLPEHQGPQGHPTFTVRFSDGVLRRVVVNRKRPTEVLAEKHVITSDGSPRLVTRLRQNNLFWRPAHGKPAVVAPAK